MISLATYERIFVMLMTTFFSAVPNMMAFGFTSSVVELIRDHDPTTFRFALGFILVSCVAFPVLVILGRSFDDLCRTKASGGKTCESQTFQPPPHGINREQRSIR